MADNYKVLNQRPDVQISPTGLGFQDVWHITYQVTEGPAKGTVGTVTVNDAEHNAAHVKAAIEDKLKHVNAIASL